MPIDLAVIGGTGLYKLAAFGRSRHPASRDASTSMYVESEQSFEGETVYGSPSAPVRVGTIAGKRVAFLARHGEGHSVPPHRINYRANLRYLLDLGVSRVLAVNAVGGITERFGPRVVAVPDQVIDYTWGRISTICEEPGTAVLHVDFGDPYNESLRQTVLRAAKKSSVALVDGGCYGATQGPRLESRAEIARLRRDGCDLVGMTGMPEAGLAREMGLDYACLAVVANWAAGCGASAAAEITLAEVLANVEAATAALPRLLEAILAD